MSYLDGLCENEKYVIKLNEKYVINGQHFTNSEIKKAEALQQSEVDILGNVKIYDIALVLRALGKL